MGIASSLFKSERTAAGVTKPEPDPIYECINNLPVPPPPPPKTPDAPKVRQNSTSQAPSVSQSGASQSGTTQAGANSKTGPTSKSPAVTKTPATVQGPSPGAPSQAAPSPAAPSPAAPSQAPKRKPSESKIPMEETNKETDASSMATQVGKKKKGKGSDSNGKNRPWWVWLIIGFVVIAVIGVLAGIAYLVYNAIQSNTENQPIVQATTIATANRPPSKNGTCTKQGCSNYANALLSGMRAGAVPCVNFYDYACGNYDQTKAEKSLISTENIKGLLDKATPNKDPIGVAKKFYEKCTPATVTDQLIKTRISLVPANSDEHALTVYVNKLAMEGYTNFGVFKLDMSRLMDPNGVNPKTVLVIQNRNNYGNSLDFGFKNIDENNAINKNFNDFDSIENTIKTEEKDLVLLADVMKDTNVPPLKKETVMEVLKGWFPDRTSADVMMSKVWTFKYEYWTQSLDGVKTDDEAERSLFHLMFAQKEFTKSMLNVMPTKDVCHKTVFNMIPQAFTNSEKIPDEKGDKLNKLVDQYKMQYLEEIKKFKVDGAKQTEMATRVNGFKIHIGYPTEWKVNLDTDIEKILDRKMGNIYSTYQEVKKWQIHQHFAHLADPLKHFPAYPSFYNQKMWYHSESNTLYIWPAFFKDEYFENDVPSYIALGGVGHLIGKAIGDAIGHQSSTTMHKDAVDCYEGQEGKANPHGISKEMVADHIGARVSHQLVKKDEQKDILPGMESYSYDKVYFLSLAKHFCEAPLDGLTTRHGTMELKELGKQRINGLATNMPEFAKAFECHPNEPMNPANRCLVYS